MTDTQRVISVEMMMESVDRLKQRLADHGWKPYKVASLRSPDEQFLIRTGYAGGEMYVQVERYSQERAEKHVSAIDPYAQVAYLRLHPRMEEPPDLAISCVLAETRCLT